MVYATHKTHDMVCKMCAGALYEISNQDALCVVEQDILDRTYSMIRYTTPIALQLPMPPASTLPHLSGLLSPQLCCRGWSCLGSMSRRRLVDGLASNLSVLVLSVGALVSAADSPEDPSEHEAAAAAHRSALSAYVFLLGWLVQLAEAEDRGAAAAVAPDAPAGTQSCAKMCSSLPRCCIYPALTNGKQPLALLRPHSSACIGGSRICQPGCAKGMHRQTTREPVAPRHACCTCSHG